jgi:hypothetical protein
VTPIEKITLQSEDYMEQGVEEKTMFDLRQIDPLTDKVKTQGLTYKKQLFYLYYYLLNIHTCSEQKISVYGHTDIFIRKRAMVLQSLQSLQLHSETRQ